MKGSFPMSEGEVGRFVGQLDPDAPTKFVSLGGQCYRSGDFWVKLHGRKAVLQNGCG